MFSVVAHLIYPLIEIIVDYGTKYNGYDKRKCFTHGNEVLHVKKLFHRFAIKINK